MATIISHKPAETEELGASWGRTAKPGLVVGLSGELGAGKTQLVKGLARGLGIAARVHSPTFTLINIYAGGRLTLFHLDLYRLENVQQIIDAGLEQYLSPEGVTVIEWAERWFDGESTSRASGTAIPNEATRSPSPVLIGPQRLDCLLLAQIEILSHSERGITYEYRSA